MDAAAASRRRHRLLGLAAVATIGAGVWAAVVLTDEERPVHAVANAYLAAIEAGEAASALERIDQGGDGDAGLVCPDLVTDEVYGAVENRPTDARITATRLYERGETGPQAETIGQPTATVDVDYTAGTDGEARSATLVLHETEAGWRVSSSSPLALAPVGVDLRGPGTLSVNGACDVASVARGTDAGTEAVALPGTYDLSYTDSAHVGELEPLTWEVPGAGSNPPTLVPEPTPEVEEAVQAEVSGLIDACLASNLTGPTCTADSRRVLRYIDVTSSGPVEDLEVVVTAAAPDALGTARWEYRTARSVAVIVEGTLTADACGPTSIGCTAGATTTDAVTFGYRGVVSADESGAVTLG